MVGTAAPRRTTRHTLDCDPIMGCGAARLARAVVSTEDLQRQRLPHGWPDGRVRLLSVGGDAAVDVFSEASSNAGAPWVLLLAYSHTGGTNPPLKNDVPLSPMGFSHVTVNDIGKRLRHEFSREDIAAVRFYGHTSAHDRIIHFSTTAGNAREVALSGVNNQPASQWHRFHELPGHRAYLPRSTTAVQQGGLTNHTFYRPGCYHWNIGVHGRWEVDDYARGEQACAATTLHQVWVQFSPGVVFFDGDSGPYHKESAKPTPGALATKRQPSVDELTIERMAMPDAVPRELQDLLLSEVPSEVQCFACEGTGVRAIALENVYGIVPSGGAAVVADMARRGSYRAGDSFSDPAIARMLSDRSGALGGAGGAGSSDAGEIEPAGPGVSVIGSKVSEEEGEHWSCSMCTFANHPSLHECEVCAQPRAAEGDAVSDADRRVSVAKRRRWERCWICNGTGSSNAMIGEFDLGEGEAKGAELDDDDLCPICYTDPPKYGISTECQHFYCEECIRDHLEEALRTGTTPCYCPCCQEDAPSSGPPAAGRIEGKALSFLEKKGVIDKEFLFRFMKLQKESESLFFKCPAKCGNFLSEFERFACRARATLSHWPYSRC